MVWAQTHESYIDTVFNSELSDSTMIVDSVYNDSINGRWGHLMIESDERLDTVLNIHIEENRRNLGMDGYRVQIYVSNRSMNPKKDAEKVREIFLRKYQDFKVHNDWVPPDFYVKVGDFRSRSEALKLLTLIQRDYPDAFIINDRIDYPD